MKWIIAILFVVGVVGVVAGLTGIQQISYSHGGFRMGHHSIWGRLLASAVGISALVAFYGCRTRRLFGWYIVHVFLWISILSATVRAVYLACTIGLPWQGILLGGIGEALKIGIWAWVLFHFWAKQRSQFTTPNHLPEPTPRSVTSPAGAGDAPSGADH